MVVVAERRGMPPVEWYHACNDLEKLEEAVRSQHVTGIEVDVGWNHALRGPVTKHAAESHVPEDVPVDKWLDALHADEAALERIVVLKFDFKNVSAVKPTVEALRRVETPAKAAKMQVWLNADILAGPGADIPSSRNAKPVDPAEFFAACAGLPEAVLSVGWTTDFHVTRWLTYTDAHVDEMLRVVRQYRGSRHVTFPIRASLFADSWAALSRLLTEENDTSLTLWTATEGVPDAHLDMARRVVRDDQLYIDCDKGPRHAFGHPARLWHYVSYVVGTWVS